LIAEDDPTQQLGLAWELRRAGYEVETVSTGDEALAILPDGDFDLLITDWDMPGMDGATLCRHVRESFPAYIYIVMLTGHTDDADLVAGLDSGADVYIGKPATTPTLLAKVKAGCRAVERQRILSFSDARLGVFNRAYLDWQLPREVHRSWRYQRSVAVVMADLDRFKQINDRFGHATGDQILQEFCQRARHSLRACDWVGRYGGEEFVLVLPETDLTHAAEAAEKIRLACQAAPAHTGQGPIAFTASFGVAALAKESVLPEGADGLLARADQALYASKASGRNRVTTARKSDPLP
jgi:two-component system chemotaxis response regulator CheY